MLNKELLKQKAISLEKSLDLYTGEDKDILAVKKTISDLIGLAKNKAINIVMDIDNVPGIYQWKNSGLFWPKNIRNSYHDFRIEISGGLSYTAKEFLITRLRKDNK